MKKRSIIRSALCLVLAAVLCLSMAACGRTQTPADEGTTSESSAPLSGALPVKALQPKQVEENPYMAKSDANIHHDGYNTDSTDEILPLGIYPEINVSYETTNANASPAIYFDSYGHAVVNDPTQFEQTLVVVQNGWGHFMPELLALQGVQAFLYFMSCVT